MKSLLQFHQSVYIEFCKEKEKWFIWYIILAFLKEVSQRLKESLFLNDSKVFYNDISSFMYKNDCKNQHLMK